MIYFDLINLCFQSVVFCYNPIKFHFSSIIFVIFEINFENLDKFYIYYKKYLLITYLLDLFQIIFQNYIFL